MIQLLGALLIVAAAGYVGVSQSLLLRRRVQLLEALCTAAELMRAEIAGELTPLPEVCMRVALAVEQPLAAVFRELAERLRDPAGQSLHSLFRQALQRQALPLRAPENQALLDLSFALGRYDVQGQLRALDLLSDRLNVFAAQARQEQQNRGRACGVLGVCTGLALVILLV